MADDTKPEETAGPKIVPQTAEATHAAATTGSPAAGRTASAPATGANPAATPHATTTPAARPAPAPRRQPRRCPISRGRPRRSRRPAARRPRNAAPAAAEAATRDADDTSPLLTGAPGWALAWGAFSAASAAALAATGRFMFPNVLYEPPQQFKAGFPTDYGVGVDERWKDKYGIWIVRIADDVEPHGSGFYALITVCTHLGCTPNWLLGGEQVQVPCHGSGFYITGVNFEGPAPRPLERAKIVLDRRRPDRRRQEPKQFQQELRRVDRPGGVSRRRD